MTKAIKLKAFNIFAPPDQSCGATISVWELQAHVVQWLVEKNRYDRRYGTKIVTMGLNTTQKMAMTGVGLAATGIGLSLVGVALIAPSVFAWTAKMMQKGTDALADRAEGASRTVGAVAGTLHRSFREAAKAGVSESRRTTYSSGE